MIDTRVAGGLLVRGGLLFARTTGFTLETMRDMFLSNDRTHVAPLGNIWSTPTSVLCDSPYGIMLGRIISENNTYVFEVEQPPEFRQVRGFNITQVAIEGTGNQYMIGSWVGINGTLLPPTYSPPQPVAATQPAEVTVPTGEAPPPPKPVPAPEKIVIKKRPLLDQVLEEGYNPLDKVSPTGLRRPTSPSASQVAAYLQCCAAMNHDLYVNEVDALLKDEFFDREWPEWAKEDAQKLKEALTKVG